MTIKEIITKYLIIAGYDGLYYPDKCSCDIKDLMPCQENCEGCLPGYFQVLNKEEKKEYGFIISSNRPKKKR